MGNSVGYMTFSELSIKVRSSQQSLKTPSNKGNYESCDNRRGGIFGN